MGAALLLAAALATAAGGPAPAWPTGERYRIEHGGQALEGELLAATPRALRVAGAGGEVELPLAGLEQLAIARPGGHRAFPGAMVGLCAGATAGLLLNASSGDPLVETGDIPALALASGLVGLLVGARLPADRWATVMVGEGAPLPAGGRARVYLRDGSIRHGRVLQLDDERLLLLPPGEDEAVALPRGEVDWLAPSPIDQPSRGERAVGGALSGALLGVSAVVVMAQLDGDAGDEPYSGLGYAVAGFYAGLGGLVVGAIFGAATGEPEAPERIRVTAARLPHSPGPALALRARF